VALVSTPVAVVLIGLLLVCMAGSVWVMVECAKDLRR
jgi:hypothetical protein